MAQPTGQLVPHSDWIAKGLRLAFNVTETALYGYYNGAVQTVVPDPGTAVPSAANTTVSSPYGDLRLNQPITGAAPYALGGMHFSASVALDVMANQMTWVFDSTAVPVASTRNTGNFIVIGTAASGSMIIRVEWVSASEQRYTMYVRGAASGTLHRASVVVADTNHHRFAVRYTSGTSTIEWWVDGVKVTPTNITNAYTGNTPTPTSELRVFQQIDACLPPNGSHVLGFNTALSDADIETLLADPWTVQSAISADTTAPALTSPTASATGATTASGSVTTNEANGTLYWLASANATELAATVKAGSSQAVTAAGVQNVTVTGLTASTSYYLHFVHTDAAANDSAVETSAQFTTDAPSGDADPPTLTGSVTFAGITQTTYTAQWPAGSDNVAVTGYEYQIGSTAGAWTDVGNNLSAAITGRTAGATETVYVRAYDAAGLRSTPAISGSVTLESIPAAGINVTEPLKNNTGTVLASQSGVRIAVLQAADLVSVYEATGLTTNTSGILATISNAAITTGQQYHVAIKLADGSVGITGAVTAS